MNHQTDQAENGIMTLPQCANADGQLPSCAPLANPYVPFQQTGADLYTASCALIRGTLFPGLDLPYGGQENTQEKLATASVELQQMGFALQELALYLDTHAEDTEAAQLFNQYVELYQQAIEQYQQKRTAHAYGRGGKRNVRLARRPLALGIQKGAVREYVCL